MKKTSSFFIGKKKDDKKSESKKASDAHLFLTKTDMVRVRAWLKKYTGSQYDF